MSRRIGSLLLLLCLFFLGCAPEWTPVQPGSEGYDAIRFTQATYLRDHGLNYYEFSANTILISDRIVSGIEKIYCGVVVINGNPANTCVGIDGDTLIIGPGAGFKEVRRTLVPNTFERIKISNKISK